MNKEHDLMEKENSKLLKEHKSMKEQKINLEKIIYGNNIKPIMKYSARRKSNSKVRN
jgi:hypothetical protein